LLGGIGSVEGVALLTSFGITIAGLAVLFVAFAVAVAFAGLAVALVGVAFTDARHPTVA
jgi:hypothetical protein